jgi:flagellar basal-body rod modification protein FlgD
VPTPVLDLTSPAGNVTPPNSLTRQGSDKLGKDEFLKLLVAQLANQDPTEPQETSQFVAQLAQFSALEQEQNAVSRLDTLLLGQATANQTAAASFIGKEITFRGGGVRLTGPEGCSASITLANPAAKLTVAVADATGRTVRTVQVGAAEAGEMSVFWDGKDDKGQPLPQGDYTLKPAAFDADGKAIPVELSTGGTVTGVAFEGGVPMLKVAGNLIKMSDVTSINERNTP